MKKQTIKLNESQLRQMIKEVLNELDWKTYANAARANAFKYGDVHDLEPSKDKKRYKKANRTGDFLDAAHQAFNDKYGYRWDSRDGDKYDEYDLPRSWETDGYGMEYIDPAKKNITTSAHQSWTDREDWDDAFRGEYGFGTDYETKNEKKYPGMKVEPKLKAAIERGNSEVSDYVQGNYKYDKGWHLKESQLRNIIKESIKKVLKESERREIFTIDIFDIENENSIDDMQYARDYKSADEAIQAAREVAQKYADYDSVINVFVMAGEYMDENGDIFGEPDAIYCISNKDKRTTMIARKNAGYSSLESDEYIG